MPEDFCDNDRQTTQARYVFVYGTLRRGCSNDITRLSPPPRWVGDAELPGVLYTLGAYPGMRLEGHAAGDRPVRGEVYAIEPALERVLDGIEGLVFGAPPQDDDEYAKREVSVSVAGQSLSCVMYEVHPRFALSAARLVNGDWCERDDLLISHCEN